ncbi:MAG: hypothetical protein M4D80_27120 [Myxococcota bacterium]|nr:hypothetical protein [Myxococcota bacterium]
MAGHSLRDVLAAWRADRSNIALANRVDEASAGVARVAVPAKLHRWWTAQANTYDPELAATLLDTLHVQARQDNVSWRIIVMRATPLVDELRAQGIDELPRGEWTNLVDRIGLLLTWPDDPRVALALARCLFRAPFVIEHGMKAPTAHASTRAVIAAVVKRVLAIGDLRAIERVSSLVFDLDAATIELFTEVIANAPEPVTPVPVEVAVAWQAVVDEPRAIAPRLVLADAYMERGDPRGEMLALSCAPLVAIERARAAGQDFDASALFGVGADRIAALVDENWYRWMDELALVASRWSRFRGGLLSEVHVGLEATPRWAWERVAGHRELCAMQRLLPTRDVDAETYARFVADLVRQPSWVYFTVQQLAALRVPLPGVSVSLYGAVPTLTAVAEQVLERSPHLERLGFEYVRQGQLPEFRELAYRLPGVHLRLTVQWQPTAEEREILVELRALRNVRVFAYGLDA